VSFDDPACMDANRKLGIRRGLFGGVTGVNAALPAGLLPIQPPMEFFEVGVVM